MNAEEMQAEAERVRLLRAPQDADRIQQSQARALWEIALKLEEFLARIR